MAMRPRPASAVPIRPTSFNDYDPRPVSLQEDDEGAFADTLSTVRTAHRAERRPPPAVRRPPPDARRPLPVACCPPPRGLCRLAPPVESQTLAGAPARRPAARPSRCCRGHDVPAVKPQGRPASAWGQDDPVRLYRHNEHFPGYTGHVPR